MCNLFKISQYAIKKLEDSGFEAFVVGGFVRNIIMGVSPADIDICTNALPGETITVFKDYRTIETGIKHGTVTVIIENTPVEITTYRVDGEYKNHRKPEAVTFTPSLQEDLKRRDFTMNAIAYCDSKGYIDLFGGKSDIEKKVIRCVGDANVRFEEDALRILRALRFSSVLGFEIEEHTRDAILSSYSLLASVSKERITDEMFKLLQGDNVCGVLKEYNEVFKFLSGHDISSVAESIASSEKNDIIRLSYFPDTSFLCLPTKYIKQIEFIKENKNASVSSRKDILMLLLRGGKENADLLIRYLKNEAAYALLGDIISSGDCYKTDMLSVDGTDIIELGFSGKEIGNALSFLLNAVICGKAANKKEALLDYFKKYF